MGNVEKQLAKGTKIILPKSAPGIAIEFDQDDPGQSTFPDFVENVLIKLSMLSSAKLGALGAQFLSEFDPGNNTGADCTLGDEYGKTTLLIRPPVVRDTGKGKRILVAVMETKGLIPKQSQTNRREADPCAQQIECWWPGSGKSKLRQEIKILQPISSPPSQSTAPSVAGPSEWSAGKIQLDGTIKKKDLKIDFRSGIKASEYELSEREFFYQGQLHTFEIALIHEMIHAYCGLKGKSRAFSDVGKIAEEKMVVGLGDNVNNAYTENKFRALLGMGPRTDYISLSITDNTATKWVPMFKTWCNQT